MMSGRVFVVCEGIYNEHSRSCGGKISMKFCLTFWRPAKKVNEIATHHSGPLNYHDTTHSSLIMQSADRMRSLSMLAQTN